MTDTNTPAVRRIREYLGRHGLTPTEWARQIDRNERTVRNWCNGSTIPGIEDAIHLEAETSRWVRVRDWVRS